MGAHEEQAKEVVLDQAAGIGHHRLPVLPQLGLGHEQRRLAVRDGLRTKTVDEAAPRRGEQPRGRTVRWPVLRPASARGFHRVAESVLHEVESAVLREEEGRESSPLLAHGSLERELRRLDHSTRRRNSMCSPRAAKRSQTARRSASSALSMR